MIYVKHVWTDEVVEHYSRYELVDSVSLAVLGTFDLNRVTGTVTSQDAVNALKLNNLETGLEDLSLAFNGMGETVILFTYLSGILSNVAEYKTDEITLKKQTSYNFIDGVLTSVTVMVYDNDGVLQSTNTTSFTFVDGVLTRIDKEDI